MHSKEYSLDGGVAGVIAADAGIDPHLAVQAGEAAQDVLSYIRDAARAKTVKAKARYLRKAHAHINDVNAYEHPDLAQAMQMRILALQGRGGDTEVAHLTPGEVVAPHQLQTADVMSALQMAAINAGVDVNRYTVGARENSLNPETGLKEFARNSRGDGLMEEITVIGSRGIGGGGGTTGSSARGMLPTDWRNQRIAPRVGGRPNRPDIEEIVVTGQAPDEVAPAEPINPYPAFPDTTNSGGSSLFNDAGRFQPPVYDPCVGIMERSGLPAEEIVPECLPENRVKPIIGYKLAPARPTGQDLQTMSEEELESKINEIKLGAGFFKVLPLPGPHLKSGKIELVDQYNYVLGIYQNELDRRRH
ncbi:MAG: hypothetical protein RIC29_17410 [Rhodospirillaceae bacterium]